MEDSHLKKDRQMIRRMLRLFVAQAQSSSSGQGPVAFGLAILRASANYGSIVMCRLS